jgi:type II secretory pathway predicted ATPase ExeA
MYQSHYGFKASPFSLLPDPDYLLFGRKHKIAYMILHNAVLNSEPFTVLTGEIGCGKTTLIRHLLRSVGPQVACGLISDTVRLEGEILERVLLAFGLEVSEGGWTEKFARFTKFALKEYAHGKRVVVVVDEAQNLDPSALEELRVLSNINADKDLLVQIILTGQPELRQKLQDPRLEQFAQRIGKLYHLLPLDLAETEAYIQHRLHVAGGDSQLFSQQACERIHEESRGIPRIINQLSDTALTYAYGLEQDRVDLSIVDLVIADKHNAWTVTPTAAAAEPPPESESSSPPSQRPTAPASAQDRSTSSPVKNSLTMVEDYMGRGKLKNDK